MYYPHTLITSRTHHFHTVHPHDLTTLIWWPTGIRQVSDRYPTASDRYPTSIRQVSDSFRQLLTGIQHPPYEARWWHGRDLVYIHGCGLVFVVCARFWLLAGRLNQYWPIQAQSHAKSRWGGEGGQSGYVAGLSEAVGSCRIPVGYSSDTCRMLSDTCRIRVGYLSATR